MFESHGKFDVPGETVKIYCEANPEYYLTAREYDDVVLAPRDESNPRQQWIMDATWGIRVKDEAGFPAFALVNKATHQALWHGIEMNEKVHARPYSKEELNEAVLWTQSDDVGNGYKCIRPVDNIDLNLDANHGDQESGGIQDGTDLILFKWKKQENQKWKITPIFNPVSQGEEYGEGATNYGDAPYGEAKHGTGVTNYGGASYGGASYEEGTAYQGGSAHVIHTHHGGEGYEEGTNYQEGPAHVVHTHHRNDFPFPEPTPTGQVVRVYCEQSPDHFLTVRYGEVVLALGNADDFSQQWIKVDEWGTKIQDEAGFPAFALVNKANLKALKHGSQEWDRVEISDYSATEVNESILWTQSADVGHGYQCIRPVSNIHLNLDAKLADGKYGNIEDGTELILFRWKKQKNQKWKMPPVD